MVNLLLLIKWLKNLLLNPIALAVIAAIMCFFAGFVMRGRMIEKAQLKQDIKAVQETIVKYEKIHDKYRTIEPDSRANIERLLSYEVFAGQAKGPAVREGDDQ